MSNYIFVKRFQVWSGINFSSFNVFPTESEAQELMLKESNEGKRVIAQERIVPMKESSWVLSHKRFEKTDPIHRDSGGDYCGGFVRYLNGSETMPIY